MKEARVIEEHKTNCVILDGEKEFIATVRGSFFTGNNFPKVGDFVLYDEVSNGKAVISEILPRTSVVTRKEVETGAVQVIVSNVNLIFIVMGLDGDFNLSRLERYLLLAKHSGVEPVVVLNKSDSVDNQAVYLEQIEDLVQGISVHVLSALTGENMESLSGHIGAETTAVLLGSSGAGKSTITNWLLNKDVQMVNDVRADDSRGKHTTTSRQLFTLPTGGYLIDTPGMRELGVLSATDDEEAVFAKFEELSRHCRFPNCDHEKSKGCAIVEAIEFGDITSRQFSNYQKLKRERLFEESKHNKEASLEQKQKQKHLRKGYRETQKNNRLSKSFD